MNYYKVTIKKSSTGFVRRKRISLSNEDYNKLLLKLNQLENGYILLDIEIMPLESKSDES